MVGTHHQGYEFHNDARRDEWRSQQALALT
jgi:hypothetical protein